ncbi:MAG: hypothetical protein LBP68_06175, partial [Acidobacteriota bacterium]|nr:hypothetical protein [Acidobacteriota bacterium]
MLLTMTVVFACTAARADQIVLKDGTAYSGTFIRGNSGTVEFRILNRTETFKTEDIDNISFVSPNPPFVEAEAQPADATKTDSLTETGTQQNQALGGAERKTRSDRPELTRKAEPSASASSSSSSSRRAERSSRSETVTLPSGTLVTIRTSQTIDTDRNRVGDVFEATLEDALNYGDQLVAPRGSIVTGRIAYSEESGALAGQSQLILELTKLTVDGVSYTIHTSDYTEVGASRGNRTA